MADQHRPTLRDVAREAGVSTTTVSDALRGRGRLPQHTRERVAAVALELGYAANPSARNLRRGRTGAVGLYVPDHAVGIEYYMHMAISAAEEALAHDLALTLLPAVRDGVRTPSLHLDGVVVSDPSLGDPTLERLVALGVPVVTCERDLTPGARHAGRVESDHAGATRALLDHLAERGAGRVALLCPGEETAFGRDVHDAYEQWSRERAREAVVAHVPLVLRPGDIRDAVRTLLTAAEPPDALLAVADGGAASALETAVHLGRRVPEDLLVASYVDGASLQSLAPPVTAVDLAPREMGRRAARLLADLIDGRVEPGVIEELPIRLVVRASTGGA